MKISSVQKKTKQQRKRRVLRVRKPILSSKHLLRLSVNRSNNHISAQIIDDQKRKTLLCFSDIKLKAKLNKTEKAKLVGAEIAKLALKKKVKQVVFDRGWYKFHGRVKALAEAARENGLIF